MTLSTPQTAPNEGEKAAKKPEITAVTPESVQAGQGRAIDARLANVEQRVNASQAERQMEEGADSDSDADTDTDAGSENSDTATTPPPAPEKDKKPKSWWVGLFGSLSAGFTSVSTWLGETGGKFGDWLGGLLGLKPKDDKKKPEAGADADTDRDENQGTDNSGEPEPLQMRSFEEDMAALMREFGLTETTDAKKDFFAIAVELGKEVQAKYGIPYQVVVAQACLESGFGQSGLTQKALNCFGYKTGSSKVPYVTMQTVEYRNGVRGTEPARFRAYASLRQSFMDYGKLLFGASRYKKAFEHKDDPKQFLAEVIKGGYATDPNYVAKAEKVVSSYGLTLS